jgi:polar amino acid transport system permease protein
MWSWDVVVAVLPALLRGLWVTVQAVFWGMLLALTLGIGWALMRRSPRRLVAWPATGLVEFVRSTPLLLQLYFLYYFVLPGVGIGAEPLTVGVIALGLHFSAYTAEVYRAGIEAVPNAQWDASRALNLTIWQTYRHVILPQALPPVIPALGNYLIAMFKETPLLSAVTVVEMLQRALNFGSVHFRYLEPLTMVGVLFLLVSLLSGGAVRFVERRLAVQVA